MNIQTPWTNPVLSNFVQGLPVNGLYATDDPSADPMGNGLMMTEGGGGLSRDRDGNPYLQEKNHKAIPVDLGVQYKAGTRFGILPRWETAKINKVRFPKDTNLSSNFISAATLAGLDGQKIEIGYVFDTFWEVTDIDVEAGVIEFDEKIFTSKLEMAGYVPSNRSFVSSIGDMVGTGVGVSAALGLGVFLGGYSGMMRAGIPLAVISAIVAGGTTGSLETAALWGAYGIGAGATLGAISGVLIVFSKIMD